MQKPSSTALPTLVALLLAALLGACEMTRAKAQSGMDLDTRKVLNGTNPPPGAGAPASASPAVGDVPDILKYPWRATRFV